MNPLTFLKEILQVALLGAICFGSILGFFFKGYELELVRIVGGISFIFIFVFFYPNFFKEGKAT